MSLGSELRVLGHRVSTHKTRLMSTVRDRGWERGGMGWREGEREGWQRVRDGREEGKRYYLETTIVSLKEGMEIDSGFA